MDDIEKVAFCVKSSNNIGECIRSAIGLGMDNRMVGVFIIDASIDPGDCDDDFMDRLEMIDDLEGIVWTNVEKNSEVEEHIQTRSLSEIAQAMAAYDLVVSF